MTRRAEQAEKPHVVATPLRTLFRNSPDVTVKEADVAEVDPAGGSVTTVDGVTYQGDYLVLARGLSPISSGAGGLKAAPLAGSIDLGTGRGGRLTVEPDLSVEGSPNV